MLELTKRSTTGQYVDVTIRIPYDDAAESLADLVFANTRALLQSYGKEVHEISGTIEDESLYSFSEVFPDSHPGSRLRGLRVREDMTQKALAAQLGIKPHHISEMESGKRTISRDMAKRLVEVLGGDYRVLL